MLNFNFIPIRRFPGVFFFVDWLDYGEPGRKFGSLWYSSFSGPVNNFSLLCIVL